MTLGLGMHGMAGNGKAMGKQWESNGKEANTLGGVLEFAFAPLPTS
jgi:hypothetical protein